MTQAITPQILPYDTLKSRIQKAFAKLRALGYICRSNFWCCQSCACADIAQMKKYDANNSKYVFWHRQDTEGYKACAANYKNDIQRNERLRRRVAEGKAYDLSKIHDPELPILYLAWDGDGEVIEAVLEEAGLTVIWDGTTGKRIAVR